MDPTVKQVAQLLNCKPAEIYKAISKGQVQRLPNGCLEAGSVRWWADRHGRGMESPDRTLGWEQLRARAPSYAAFKMTEYAEWKQRFETLLPLPVSQEAS